MAAEGIQTKGPVTDFFQSNDELCDVTLVVEETDIYFNRTLLMVSSPVFARMLTADFKEKSQQTIPLPGKKLGDFMAFLRQIHPAHSWQELTDAELEPLLQLAEEYDVGHLKGRCSRFIRDRVDSVLPIHEEMRYLSLISVHQLDGDLQAVLVSLACDHPVEELQGSPYFTKLEPSTQTELVIKRCQLLQDEKDEAKRLLMETGRIIRQQVKPIVRKLPSDLNSLPAKCPGCCVLCTCPSDSRQFDDTPDWSAKVTSRDLWCSSCTTVATVQRSFCRGCVMQKTYVIVHNLRTVLKPLAKAPFLQSSNLLHALRF